MDHFLFLVGTHFIGDFPFQSEWMVKFKGTDCAFPVKGQNGAPDVIVKVARWYEVLFYHVTVYVFTNVVFSRLVGYDPTPQGIAIDAGTHFVIDTLKCRGFIRHIWVDQLCHLTVRASLWHVGWL